MSIKTAKLITGPEWELVGYVSYEEPYRGYPTYISYGERVFQNSMAIDPADEDCIVFGEINLNEYNTITLVKPPSKSITDSMVDLADRLQK